MVGRDKYGIVLDAGSSGTRIHIFRWKEHEEARKKASKKDLQQLPQIETRKEWVMKVNPGISSLANKPEEVGDYLAPLFKHALKVIPKAAVPETPIFLLATAGLRMVERYKRDLLLDGVCTFTRRNTEFLLQDCKEQIQMISGETEGLYGWIATNYLLGGFEKQVQHPHAKALSTYKNTYGFLDMGGASAQLAFAPSATEATKHEKDLTLLRLRRLDGEPMEYKVFVTTWLGYGVNEARKVYVKKLLEMFDGSANRELPDPCLPKGLLSTLDGKEIEDKRTLSNLKQYLVGTGKFDECLRTTYPLIAKNGPCHNAACLLSGPNVPRIDFEINRFVGISEYWYSTHDIFKMGVDEKAFDFVTYQKRVKEFCSLEWNSIEKSVDGKKWGKEVDEQRAMGACFKASWLLSVLHEGIGVPRVGIEGSVNKTDGKTFFDVFRPMEKVKGTEVSWTLGKMLLYASSQVPPPPKAPVSLPVGFGPNTPSLAAHSEFHYGGHHIKANQTASYIPLDPTKKYATSSARSMPSFSSILVFVCVLTLFLYMFRRNKFVRRLADLPSAIRGNRHKRWATDSYERVAPYESKEIAFADEGLADYRKNGKLSVSTSNLNVMWNGGRERTPRSREVSPSRRGKYF